MRGSQAPTNVIALALVQRGGRWLAARRPPHVHLGGLWEFPGGKCQPGETVAQAAVRELREECGVDARPERELQAVRWDYGDRVVELVPVICQWQGGEARPLESDECRWVDLAELRRLPMPPANARILELLAAAVS